MKKYSYIFCFVLLLTGNSPGYAQHVLNTVSGLASFHSSAPLEDISAFSDQVSGNINIKTKRLSFTIPVSSFRFENTLMQEHFNQKYLETHRYPKASFNGRIINQADLSLPGEHEVVARGTLSIHGISDERTIRATVTNTGKDILVKSDFNVVLEHHNIRIPALMAGNIAEEVKIDIQLRLSSETGSKPVAAGRAQQALLRED